MTQLPTTGESTRQAPTRVACLHEHADGWACVVASSENGSRRVLAAERLSVGDQDGVRRLMSKHGASRLVRVVPMGEAVVRCVTLPSGDEAGARAAVQLMAEAQLPAHIEVYRRAGGVLPARDGDETRDAMLAGWIGADVPARVLPDDDEETWVPAGAALAHLIALDETGSGWGAVKGADASCCVGAATGEGLRVRSGRLGDASNAIAELHTGASIKGGRSSAFSEGVVERLGSMAATSGVGGEWLDRHALAVGGALCALEGSSLAGLLAEPPRYHYTPGQRAALTLADGRRATTLIVLGLILILVAPVALIFSRHDTLKTKLENAREAVGAEAQAEVDELVRNAAFTSALRERAVPATKVLGAVADAMPVGDSDSPLGVQIETIDITADSVTIKGEASSRSAAQRFVDALTDRDIFGSVPPPDVKDNDRGGSTFTINARLARIELPFQLAGNFIEEPFAVRLHGEDARGYDYASVDKMTGSGASSGRSGSRQGGSRTRTASFDDNTSEQQGGDPVPEVLGAEKIAAITVRQEALDAFLERRNASTRSDIDQETKRALEQDVELLRSRLRELPR